MINKQWTELFGAAALTKTEDVGVVGGLTGFDTDNRFNLYQQLYTISPHTFISIQKLGLSLVKDFRFEGKKSVVKNFEKWSEEIDLNNKLQTMARLSFINGTYVALYLDKKTGKEDNFDDIDFVPLLMSNVTLLPDGIELNKPNEENEIILPPVTRVIVDEKYINKVKSYRRDNCFIFAHCPRDIVQTDILNRQTYGIYGISLFESIKETIYKYIDLVSGYTNFIKKYGIGRYFIDYGLIAELVKTGEMTLEDALEVMQQLADTNAEIKENEDIVGIGFDIKQLDSGGSNINVEGMKSSLETDIQIGLYQSPVTMGKTAGSTFASAYVSEDDRLLALEGFQKSLASALNGSTGIIGKRLEIMGKKSDEVKIVFDELSKPAVTANDMKEALVLDAIAISEYRTKALNLPELKPDDENTPIIQKEVKPGISTKVMPDGSPDNYPNYPNSDK